MRKDYQRGWWNGLQKETYSRKRNPWLQRISIEPYKYWRGSSSQSKDRRGPREVLFKEVINFLAMCRHFTERGAMQCYLVWREGEQIMEGGGMGHNYFMGKGHICYNLTNNRSFSHDLLNMHQWRSFPNEEFVSSFQASSSSCLALIPTQRLTSEPSPSMCHPRRYLLDREQYKFWVSLH